ncbi:MAG: PKD domain-containing protein [Bacteroidota bacterium]
MKQIVKNIKNTILYPLKSMAWVIMVMCMAVFSSCEKYEAILPEEGTLPDLTPPEAGFSFNPNEANYKQINFTNLSFSATDYHWDFGDGDTSNEKAPVHTYEEDGAYVVSLTATDKLGISHSITQDIEITEPEYVFAPEILNSGFDIEGEDSYRDHWRNGDLGGVIQITDSPIHAGEKAAKFPSAGDRIAYQLITVEQDKEYIVSFYYTMKTSPAGTLSVAILAGDITDPTAIEGATIASVTVSDQTDADTYMLGSVSFNSGNNSEIAIYVSNVDVESRIDSFTIVED